MTTKHEKIIIAIMAIFGLLLVLVVYQTKDNPKQLVNYQSQIDSLNGVISTQDQIIKSMVKDLDSLIEVKEQIKYVHGRKIIEYRSITTPQRVQQLAERL